MKKQLNRTYIPFKDFLSPSKQTEYTEQTALINTDGTLNARGWARHNVFDYDRKLTPALRRKEWEFYIISNGKNMALVSIVSVAIGGYINIAVVDLSVGKYVAASTMYFLGGKKCTLPLNSDGENVFTFKTNNAEFKIDTHLTSREIYYKKNEFECSFQMDIFENHENITTVFPFYNQPKRFFYTAKQNCMPCKGTFKKGDKIWDFSKDDSFCVLDWGRIAAPRKVVWYWGNGSSYIFDKGGHRHIFGFEITWGIGDESNATETCLFYDGKAHKIGAVDVEVFPKPDKYMHPWHIVSEDGRFDMTMTPFCDNHTDTNIPPLLRMNCHQAHGLWNGTATLDDGTVLEIKDMYAFCEYVENKW